MLLALSFCTCVFCVAGLLLVSSDIRSPFWGRRHFKFGCIYVSGPIQAVVFYLRVFVLVRVFSDFASLRGVLP